MNRRDLLKLFGSTGVAAAIGGAAALERMFEPMRAISPSGWIVVKGYSPNALTLQWGISDAEGIARYPLDFNRVFSVVQEGDRPLWSNGHSQTAMQPGRNWVALGLT